MCVLLSVGTWMGVDMSVCVYLFSVASVRFVSIAS